MLFNLLARTQDQEKSPLPHPAEVVGAISPSAPKSLCLILASRAQTDEPLRQAVNELRALGVQVDVRAIWERGQGALFAQEAAARGVDAVVAAGGDGTINEVINGILKSGRRDLPLGILPFGTANDFARAVGIPTDDIRRALMLMVQAPAVPVDLARVHYAGGVCYCLNVTTAGFGADVTAETPDALKNLLGGVAYSLAGIARVLERTPVTAHVRAPGWEWNGQFLLLAVGNARSAGGGFRITPRALLNDGLLDLLIVPDVPLDSIGHMLWDLLTKGELNEESLTTLQAPWIEVSGPEPFRVNVDGESIEGTHFRFDVTEERLPVFLPVGNDCLVPVPKPPEDGAEPGPMEDGAPDLPPQGSS